MAYDASPLDSLETLMDRAVSIDAGLSAMPELETLAPPWSKRLEAILDSRDARDAARRVVLKASAKVKVFDTRWDFTVKKISSVAYQSAGKKKDVEPYASTFGAVTAADAIDLGPHKATAFGTKLLSKMTALNHMDLNPLIAVLTADQENLANAAKVRDDAQVQAATHDVLRRKHVEEFNKLLAETEVGILTRFPGRRDLVRAILAPERATRSNKSTGTDAPEQESGDQG